MKRPLKASSRALAVAILALVFPACRRPTAIIPNDAPMVATDRLPSDWPVEFPTPPGARILEAGYRKMPNGGRVARVRFTTRSRPAEVEHFYNLQIPAGTYCRGRVAPPLVESAVIMCSQPPPGDDSQVLLDITALREEDVTEVEGAWIRGPSLF